MLNNEGEHIRFLYVNLKGKGNLRGHLLGTIFCMAQRNKMHHTYYKRNTFSVGLALHKILKKYLESHKTDSLTGPLL